MNSENWFDVADRMVNECPSSSLRQQTAAILTNVQHLGPLRSPELEFKRAYVFLTYNEPARVATVVAELLEAFKRGGGDPPAKYNAWNYVTGALDLWLARARVFYTAAGLVEGALKARLDTRLRDEFGAEWPVVPDAVPSSILLLAQNESTANRLSAIRRFLENWNPVDDGDAFQAKDRLTALVESQPVAETNGAAFLRGLDFSKLRSFFQTKRLWTQGPRLETLFRDSTTGQPPLRSQLMDAFETIHSVRNDVAHYRPADGTSPHSFTKGLFALSKIAVWMSVDLQHFYGSVDTRHPTELSLLLEDPGALAKLTPKKRSCAGSSCGVGEPLSVMLASSPTDASDLAKCSASLGCLYHRVQLRVAVHRPHGE